MPIVIQNPSSNQVTYSPKFFSELLTGNGQGQGLLNATLNRTTDRYQAALDTNVEHSITNINSGMSHRSDSNAEYYHWTFTNIQTYSDKDKHLFAKTIMSYPLAKETFLVYHDTKNDERHYAIPVHAKFFKPYSKNVDKVLTVRYLLVTEINDIISTQTTITDSPFYILGVKGVTDPNEQENYSVFKAISAMSELFQVHFNEITSKYIDELKNTLSTSYVNLFSSIQNLDIFKLTFEHYTDLYTNIQKWEKLTLSQDNSDALQNAVLSNTNLLMLESVHALIAEKNKHAHTSTPQQPVQLADFLSPAQNEAATTNAPFVLVQAGAGTGKSTTIIERIKYMEAAGVDPSKIRVLSLTNAAADNILEKNNKIQSMTIAKYISEIYKINYPQQDIVDFATLKNTIMIYAKHLPNARQFKKLITDKDSMELLIFIRDNFDEVVEILNLTGQTTLQIQSYISYLKAETFDYGDDTADHFIVDETQDNNIFEFIYLMKIASLRKASLYIVGDASQTLYEFRGASAQALNAIETSGVFECIKLDINYRSNQYVLDFANITLADIDVNRFAQIQLQSDVFETMSKHDFKQTIQVFPVSVNRLSEFDEYAHSYLTNKAYAYVHAKIEAGEKVILLARKGSDVRHLESWAENAFSDKTIMNLVPKRSYSSNLFSTYIERYWDDLVLTPKKSVIKTIAHDMDSKLNYIYGSRAEKMRQPSQNQINQWVKENGHQIKFWESEYHANRLTHKQLMDFIRDNLIRYEVQKNVIRQSLLRQEQDQQDKEEMIKQADILISTVHSVKGLEFDNVVFLHRNSDSGNEEEKRIDYVALTRAKKSELIIDIHSSRSYSKFAHNFEGLLETYQ